jgi:hypothetical protein
MNQRTQSVFRGVTATLDRLKHRWRAGKTSSQIQGTGRARIAHGQTIVFGASLIAFALGLTSQPASAGCIDLTAFKPVSLLMPGALVNAPRIIRVSTAETSEAASSDGETAWNWSWEEEPVRRAPIVGLWAFKYLSKGNMKTLGIPDGAVLDGGNTLWYADGNENTVSGVRAPATGDVCLGIWKRTGEWTYELNHIGLSWNTEKGIPGGPAFIKQYVTLGEHKDTYTGTVTIRQLDPDGKTLSTPAPIKGTIIATRVKINTDTQESLP